VIAIRVITSDRPGRLADITRVIAEEGGNILEVFHHRAMLNVPPKGACVDLTLETHGRDHAAAISRRWLRAATASPAWTHRNPDRPAERYAVCNGNGGVTEKPKMTDLRPSGRFLYDPLAEPDLYDGILAKRIVAFFIDAFLVVVLMIPAALMVFILGFITLGLAWLIFPVLFAIVALAYVALTLGGPLSGTLGNAAHRGRDAHLERPADVSAAGGDARPGVLVLRRPPDALVLLVGLLTYRKQLLHDLFARGGGPHADALPPARQTHHRMTRLPLKRPRLVIMITTRFRFAGQAA